MNKILGRNFNWAKPECPVEKISMEIKNIPSYMGCVDDTFDSADDYMSDLIFGVCPHTGTIQSLNRLPLDKVYIRPHNACVGKVWEAHNDSFAEFIMRNTKPGSIVYEIGGGDGNIASRCMDYVREWHCIDPNVPENHFVHPRLVYHNEWYRPEKPIWYADAVVHSNFLEHVRFPKEFLESIRVPLQLFSVPNFRQGMLVGNPSMLNFEHEHALTENVLDELLDSIGYSVSSIINYNDFTLFYKVQRGMVSREMRGLDYDDSMRLLLRYESNLRTQAMILESKVRENLRTGIPFTIFFFGAHIFYTILRSCGLSTEFSGIIDNSPLKIGKRLYGTDHIVAHPDIVRDMNNLIVVIPHTPYQAEMIEQIENLNNGAYIISVEEL